MVEGLFEFMPWQAAGLTCYLAGFCTCWAFEYGWQKIQEIEDTKYAEAYERQQREDWQERF
jgi:hypothetical protein